MDKDQAIREYLSIENNGRHYEFVSSIQDFDRSAVSIMVRLYMENAEEILVADMVIKNNGCLFAIDNVAYSFAGAFAGKALFKKGLDRELIELDLNQKIRKIF